MTPLTQGLSVEAVEALTRGLDDDAKAVLAMLAQKQTCPKGVLYGEMGFTRHRGDKAMLRLESFGFVSWVEQGTAKEYHLTSYGIQAQNYLATTLAKGGSLS